MRMYRQGDILLIESNQIIGSKTNTDILMEGSITGHHHKVKNGTIYKQETDRDLVFGSVVANEGCVLIHDEHKSIKLPEGIYNVRRQREVTGYVKD